VIYAILYFVHFSFLCLCFNLHPLVGLLTCIHSYQQQQLHLDIPKSPSKHIEQEDVQKQKKINTTYLIMATYILPTTIYQPPPQVRREARVTLIEDEVQINITSCRYPSKLMITSPMTDDVPTPRVLATNITPVTDATSAASSMWSQRSSKSSFDSLYDLTDSEGEEVPLKLSASVKKHVDESQRSRYPSLVIPSPSQWPSIHKPQSLLPVGLSPASKLASPSTYSVWQAQRLRVPSGTSTPSLDGSLTSEELALSSCPSTPDLASRQEIVDEWEQPCQLHPDAFETLHQLSPEEVARDSVIETILEVPEEASHEMREIIKSTPVRLDFALLSVESDDLSAQDPISALSVPSPGGFFSSLAPVAAQTWTIRTPEPSTSVAENFYGVPWRGIASEHPQRVRTTTIVTSALASGPPTAIKDVFSPIDPTIEVAEIISDVCLPLPSEYNDLYQEKLKQSALAHFERTKGWLEDQFTMVTKDVAAPTTPDMTSPSIVSATSSPSKKSVRFAPEAASPRPSTSTAATTVSAPYSPAVATFPINDIDSIFLDGFRSIMSRRHAADAFVHRQARLETTHTQRRNFPSVYLRNLHNDFEIAETSRPVSTRPISTMLPAPSPEDDEKREIIAAVERERQVLKQVSPQTWELEALAYVRGGALLTKEITAHITSIAAPQILDFGGKPNADWGWCIATSFPAAKVCTVYFEPDTEVLEPPSNHVSVLVDKPLTLPFADNTFHVISARTLHSLLRFEQWGPALDEMHRVLKPSGYLDFSLLDAILINVAADSWGQVVNAEFGHRLQQRGYEREPTKLFLTRLEHAGFKDVKRTWMFLGMGDVNPTWKDDGKSPVVAQAPTRPLPDLPAAKTPIRPFSALSISKAAKKSTITKRPTFAKKTSTVKKLSTPTAKSPTPPPAPEPVTEDDDATQDKPKGAIHYQVPIQDASGNILLDIDGKPSYYPPALTGSTSAIAPVTGLLGARLWEQWVYKLAREMDGEEAELKVMEQVWGVLEQGGKMGSGFGCLMGVCRK
jgi:SAM-dependent methyltransferase